MVQAQPHHILLHVEERKVLQIEVDDPHELLLKLIFGAVDVGVIHLHRAHAHQAKEFAAIFVAVAGAILGQAHGQIAITARAAGKDLVMEGAVHRLDIVLRAPIQLHWRVHAVAVIGQVTAAYEEIFLGEMGRAHLLIAGGVLHIPGQLLQLLDNDRAIWQPQGQPRPDLLVEDKNVQFTPQLAMVALFGLFQHLQVGVEIFLVAPSRAVDALQHRLVLVTAPIGPGHTRQFEAIGRNLPRMFQMGPAAEILEAILLVGADRRLVARLVAIFIDPAARQPVDQFELVGLVMEERARLVGAHLAVGKGMAATDNLAHALFDLLQIFG